MKPETPDSLENVRVPYNRGRVSVRRGGELKDFHTSLQAGNRSPLTHWMCTPVGV
jgi:hypothetical protein